MIPEVQDANCEFVQQRATHDPEFFAQKYLSSYQTSETAGFHRDLYRRMADPAPALRWAFAAPRGHAKSTLASIHFVLWSLCAKRRKFIVLVSNTEPQAEMFLDDVRHELEHNGPLRETFGNKVGATWRRNVLTTPEGERVVAKGAGSALRGLRSRTSRPDLIICDDIENEENTATSERRSQVWRWFSRALMNALSPDGAVWVIGTILHHDSLLANLIHGNEERGIAKWPGQVWRALDEDNRPLWPAMWPIEKLLARRREIGSLAFAQEFQNKPCGPEEAVFREEWLQTPALWYERAPEGMTYVQAVDPAISREARADYFCHITLGSDAASGDLYVVDIVRDRMSFDRQVAVVIEQARRWNPAQIGIEAVAYQAGLLDAVNARIALPVVRLQSPRDKITRALRLSAIIENGKLRLRRNDPSMRLLRDELAEFPHAAHDDQVDALGYAVELAAAPREARVWVL
jgi:predicted phage terminase large subunit-like protein